VKPWGSRGACVSDSSPSTLSPVTEPVGPVKTASPRSGVLRPASARAARRACSLWTALKVLVIGGCLQPAAAAPAHWDVREFGARGDGVTLDTAAIQNAIDACAEAGGGVVRLPPGRYLSGTIRLRSHVTLELTAGARLVGTTNLHAYAHPSPPSDAPEARWGKWHRGLIIGENIQNVTLRGPGVVDGNRVFDPTGEEKMRGPHAIVLMHAQDVTLEDLTIEDAANYGMFFMVSDNVTLRRVRFVGGWDGVHWRGTPDRWCTNVNLLNCEFYTGDDAIAGRYWAGTRIMHCVINSSCNGLRLIGPAYDLTVAGCSFFGPGRRPHLTSREQRRTNMLSGILLQPGAWDATRGRLDAVWLVDNTMQQVASPVTLWTRPGNSVGRVVVQGLEAIGVYRAAFSAERWGPEAIESVVFRGVRAEFTGGASADAARRPVSSPGVDARPLPAWGFYARGVQRVELDDVQLRALVPDSRPVLQADQVEELILGRFDFSDPPAGVEPLVLNEVKRVLRRRMPAAGGSE
jgi:hypothetical protein